MFHEPTNPLDPRNVASDQLTAYFNDEPRDCPTMYLLVPPLPSRDDSIAYVKAQLLDGWAGPNPFFINGATRGLDFHGWRVLVHSFTPHGVYRFRFDVWHEPTEDGGYMIYGEG